MSHGSSLDGKRVLVVGGGGGGNGRAISAAVAAAGAAVAVLDVDGSRAEHAAAELRSAGALAFGIAGDVGDPSATASLVAAAADGIGGLDTLITVVGGHQAFAPWVPAGETTDAAWDTIMDLNLTYVFRFVRAVLPHFLPQGGGTIVSIGSIAGVMGSPNSAPYGVAKAGLISLAKTVSAEYGREGIRMNVVSCGAVSTPVALAQIDPEMMARIPLGRPALPQDIANAAVFLASDASAYVSGANLVVDGGVLGRSPLRLPNTVPSMAG